MAAGNTNVQVTAGSGTAIACYQDASNNEFQRVFAALEDTQKATYYANYTGQSVGTGATTNIFTVAGSATKTVKIVGLYIAATAATAASYFDVLVKRQSTADTGGTAATAATILPADINDAAASAAAPKFYTAAPTAGTVTGTLFSTKIFAPITGTPAPVVPVALLEAGRVPMKSVTLRGTTDIIAVTLNGVTPANATSFDVTLIWTEE